VKNITIIIALICIAKAILSQSPPGIPYQAIARTTTGEPYAGGALQARFSLHEQTVTGTVSYAETHSLQTDEFGLFSTTFGAGAPVAGTFAAINWGLTTKYLQVEIDLGNGWIDMGTQQLMSVPYAMYAGSSSLTTASSISADSILTMYSATTLNSGNYQVPSNESWKVVSINKKIGFGSIPQTLSFSNCSCLPPAYGCTNYCFYSTLPIPIIKVADQVFYGSVLSGDQRSITAANCAQCPPTYSFNISFTWDNSILLPIWLNSGEALEIYDNLRVSIEKYK